MRYSRAERLIQLALEMQAASGGLTIAEIQEKFEVSRRTAIRMRDAVMRAFPNAAEVPTGERTKRWRLSPGVAQSFAEITSDDLASIDIAAAAMERANLPLHSQDLRGVATKIRNLLEAGALNHIEPDLEALTEAEGLAHRAGPRPYISASIFDGLRTAIKSFRKVSFDYASRSGRASTRRTVAPLGFLYGHRHYLVALQEGVTKPKFFSLPSISKLKLEADGFERDPNFNLKEFVSHSFGVFEEAPVDVVWRFSAEAAPLARTFVFHHSQSVEDEANGSLIVRFRAGGLLEMAWHLMSWGDQVEVIKPAALRDLMPEKAQSWPALP
jgi:predicted DNA-binding transcriptional regulator YafY